MTAHPAPTATRPRRRPRRAPILAALAATVAVVLTACSSSGGSSSGGSGGTGGATGSASSGTGAASTSLAAAHKGLVGVMPTQAVTPPKNASVWIVSCGQTVTTCSGTAAGAEAAAKSLGWTTHVCDGQLNPGGWSACVRQAIAAKPDAIDMIAIDCGPVQQALTEANAAGIKTINGGGFDCSELGGKQTYTGSVQYQPGLTNHAWWATLGRLQADWVIGATKGSAKVLSLKFTDEAWGSDIQNAFVKELATCSGCSVVKTLDIGNSDVLGGALRSKFSTALLQSPTANAVNLPIDGWFPAGLAQAITSSGRSNKLSIIGAIGEAANMGYIRSGGGEDASAAFSGEQSGWGGIDVAARVLTGQKGDNGFFPEGLTIQVVDKNANLPADGKAYLPQIDFKAAYGKLWGQT